jgi:chaperonin GroEL (HSP60 family)
MPVKQVLILRRRALEAPTRQIAENPVVDGGVVVNQMRAGTGTVGLDAARKEYVGLVEAGIIEPTEGHAGDRAPHTRAVARAAAAAVDVSA